MTVADSTRERAGSLHGLMSETHVDVPVRRELKPAGRSDGNPSSTRRFATFPYESLSAWDVPRRCGPAESGTSLGYRHGGFSDLPYWTTESAGHAERTFVRVLSERQNAGIRRHGRTSRNLWRGCRYRK